MITMNGFTVDTKRLYAQMYVRTALIVARGAIEAGAKLNAPLCDERLRRCLLAEQATLATFEAGRIAMLLAEGQWRKVARSRAELLDKMGALITAMELLVRDDVAKVNHIMLQRTGTVWLLRIMWDTATLKLCRWVSDGKGQERDTVGEYLCAHDLRCMVNQLADVYPIERVLPVLNTLNHILKEGVSLEGQLHGLRRVRSLLPIEAQAGIQVGVSGNDGFRIRSDIGWRVVTTKLLSAVETVAELERLVRIKLCEKAEAPAAEGVSDASPFTLQHLAELAA